MEMEWPKLNFCLFVKIFKILPDFIMEIFFWNLKNSLRAGEEAPHPALLLTSEKSVTQWDITGMVSHWPSWTEHLPAAGELTQPAFTSMGIGSAQHLPTSRV